MRAAADTAVVNPIRTLFDMCDPQVAPGVYAGTAAVAELLPTRRLPMMLDFLGPGDVRVLEILAFKVLFPLRFCSRLGKFSRAQRKT